MDVCQAILSMQIPLNKLSNNVFRTFQEKHTGKSILMKVTLRKGYDDDIFNSTTDNMKMGIQQNQIWVSIDETCDGEEQFKANVIVEILRPDYLGGIFLLHSEKLSKANHSTICKLFDNAMGIIFSDDIIKYNNVSDVALYMVKAGRYSSKKLLHKNDTRHGEKMFYYLIYFLWFKM